MLKYVSKFALDILPSVVATILGAYIVNHYIVTKPGADASVAAAMSRAVPKKADVRTGAKPSESSADVGNIPERGVKAKGISEKAILEKTAAERPAVAEKSQEKSQERSQEKSAEKPVETASIPVDARRHQPGPREKAVAKSAPVPVSPPMPAAAVAPVIAAPNTAPPVEMAAPVEEHRDANDLARAAIERLRGASEGSPRPQESARIPDPPRVVSAPSVAAPLVSAPPVRPLPPPIMVSTPAPETFGSAPGSSRTGSLGPAAAGIDDPGRPTPPADIPEASPPPSRPLDLRAEAVEPPARREHTTVAEDVLLAAKSVFHAVLPKYQNPRSD